LILNTQHDQHQLTNFGQQVRLLLKLHLICVIFLCCLIVIDSRDCNLILMLDLRRFGRQNKPTKLEPPCLWCQCLSSRHRA